MTNQDYCEDGLVSEVTIDDDDYEALVKLARRTLWIAYSWNDHNFEHPLAYARQEASSLGIKSFEEANNWLERITARDEDKIVNSEWISERDTAGEAVAKIARSVAYTASYRHNGVKETVETLVAELKELSAAIEKLAEVVR